MTTDLHHMRDADTAVLPLQPPAGKRKTATWAIAASVAIGLCFGGAALVAVGDDADPAQPAFQSPSGSGRLVDMRPSSSVGEVQPESTAVPTAAPTSAGPPHVRATPTATGGSRPTTTQPRPSPMPKMDPRFDNCQKAIQAGYGPYRRGVDSEYAWYRDPDGDGLACERR